MNEPFLLFSECDRIQLAVNAKKVLAGSLTISVWVDGACQNLFGVGFPPSPFYSVDKNCERSDLPMPEWKRFESGMYRRKWPSIRGGSEFYASPEEPKNRSAKQLYLPEILDWLKSEGCALSRGLWRIPDPELMAKGLQKSLQHPPCKTQHYKIEIDGRPRRVVVFAKVDGFKGKTYYEDFDQVFLEYAFHQKQSFPESKELKLKSQTRTRSDAIRTIMNAYLVECTAKNKMPDLDECWRFTAEQSEIDTNLDGKLIYPIRGGKDARNIDRKRFSERFKDLLRDR